MKLAETTYDNAETGCCARLDVAHWDGQQLQWTDKPFLKDHVRALFHVPVNMASVMVRDQQAIEAAAAWPADPLWLSDEISPWGSDLYVAVDHPVPGTETARLTGTFLTKVFEGPYRDVGKWITTMDADVAAKGFAVTRHLFYYATCPTCAKHFGTNQVVLFAQIA
jgi:hypothetical protein